MADRRTLPHIDPEGLKKWQPDPSAATLSALWRRRLTIPSELEPPPRGGMRTSSSQRADSRGGNSSSAIPPTSLNSFPHTYGSGMSGLSSLPDITGFGPSHDSTSHSTYPSQNLEQQMRRGVTTGDRDSRQEEDLRGQDSSTIPPTTTSVPPRTYDTCGQRTQRERLPLSKRYGPDTADDTVSTPGTAMVPERGNLNTKRTAATRQPRKSRNRAASSSNEPRDRLSGHEARMRTSADTSTPKRRSTRRRDRVEPHGDGGSTDTPQQLDQNTDVPQRGEVSADPSTAEEQSRKVLKAAYTTSWSVVDRFERHGTITKKYQTVSDEVAAERGCGTDVGRYDRLRAAVKQADSGRDLRLHIVNRVRGHKLEHDRERYPPQA